MNQLSGSRVVEPYLERRILLALLFVIVVWGLLIARLFYLQVADGLHDTSLELHRWEG